MKYYDRPDYRLREFAKSSRWLKCHIIASDVKMLRLRSEEEVQYVIGLQLRQEIGRHVAEEVVTKGLVKIEHDMEGMHVRFNAVFLTYDELMDMLFAAYNAGRLDMPHLKATP